jgi:hypothetical protein
LLEEDIYGKQTVLAELRADPYHFPEHTSLYQNYPNPFNAQTSIRFSLAWDTPVTLTIYDSIGKIVKRISYQSMLSGQHYIVFDAHELASGIYFYSLDTDQAHLTRQMILLR